jgi:hypothetical protein
MQHTEELERPKGLIVQLSSTSPENTLLFSHGIAQHLQKSPQTCEGRRGHSCVRQS